MGLEGTKNGGRDRGRECGRGVGWGRDASLPGYHVPASSTLFRIGDLRCMTSPSPRAFHLVIAPNQRLS